MIAALLLLHLAAALLAPSLVRRLGTRVFWGLALAPAATAVWASTRVGTAGGAEPHTEHLRWVSDLGMDLTFRMDTLAWVLTLVVSVVGTLVLVYCAHYLREDDRGNVGLLAASLTAFAGAMLGLVTADDLLLLYVFWELTTILSYLLIGYLSRSPASTRAAKQALIVTTAGGLAMLVGIVILGTAGGTYRISELVALPTAGTATSVGVVLLLVGAVSKSALVPFHFWLPGAMVAPTPISAYLHAAAMVKAGVYLVARFAPAYADLPAWQVTVLVLGGATMLLGAFRATRQNDLKLLLAYGTVSQLGFLIILLGYGSAGATLAGLTLLVAHALFKSSLFLAVGTIDHATGTRDIRRLTGVRGRMPWLAAGATLSALSMAGLPVLLGFVGKEAALTAVLDPRDGWWSLQGAAATAVVLGSVLTAAYSFRFLWGAFTDRSRPPVGDPAPPHWHRPTWVLVAVPVVLGVGGLVLGVTSTALEEVLAPHAALVTHVPGPEVHLGLWHGFTPALGVSVAVWVLGALWWGLQSRRPVEVPVPLWPFDAGRTYHHLMRGIDRVALEVTGFLQRGSLPVLLGTIVGVVIVVPTVTMVTRQVSWPSLRLADSAAQVATAGLVVSAAYLATRARRRLRAVFLVGVTGYGTAYLYLLHGAPDLALTQLLVETVTLVVLVLVLRRLSGRFPDDPTRANRRVRAVIGAAAAAVVGSAAVIASGSRVQEPAGAGLADRAVDYGGGYNIVNVILVDVRAWDTMGELSVILAAATGVASLIFLRDENLRRAAEGILRARDQWARPGGETGADEQAITPWIARVDLLDPDRRSTILEIVTHLVFHTLILWSIYLLLSGHNQPGGGFAAGIVAGLALCLRYLAGYGAELSAALPVRPASLLGTGLFIAGGSAVLPMLFGSPALRTWIADVPVPLLGEVHVVTSLLFDVGVYLVVLGLMLDILRSFGSGIDEIAADEKQRVAGR